METLSKAAINANQQYFEALKKKQCEELAKTFKQISDCIDTRQLINNQKVNGVLHGV